MTKSLCPAKASTGQGCQLPEHHNSPHQHKDQGGKLTWEPRYVGDLRRAAENGPWYWRGLLGDVLNDLGEDIRSPAIDEARAALKRDDVSQ